MKRKRRTFSAEYKLEMVLDLLRGEKGARQICCERGRSEWPVYRWYDRFLAEAPTIFEDQRASVNASERERVAELDRLVGRHSLMGMGR